MTAAPPIDMESSKSAGPAAAPATNTPGTVVCTVFNAPPVVSINPCDSSGSLNVPAISVVPLLGSIPTDKTTISIWTSMGRPMVVSSPFTKSLSPRFVISVTIPRMKFTFFSSCAFQ